MKNIAVWFQRMWNRYALLEQRVTALENSANGKYTCRKCGNGVYRITGDRKFEWGSVAGNSWRCDKCGHEPNVIQCKQLDNA